MRPAGPVTSSSTSFPIKLSTTSSPCTAIGATTPLHPPDRAALRPRVEKFLLRRVTRSSDGGLDDHNSPVDHDTQSLTTYLLEESQ